MPKYIVTVKEIWTYDVEVEAENKETARREVENNLAHGVEYDAKYDYTINSYQWDVKKQED